MSIRQGTNTIAGSGYTKSEVDTLLTGKANVDMNNLTSTGKEVCANMAMPSGSYVDLTLGAAGSTYTAPADGYFTIAKTSGVANAYLSIDVVSNNERIINGFTETSTTTRKLALSVPVSKDDTVYVYYNATGTTTRFRFVYANGAI